MTLLVWVDVETKVRSASTPIVANGLDSTDGRAKLEKTVSRNRGYVPRADDLRIALFFLFFVQVAFFGTGKYVTRIIIWYSMNKSSLTLHWQYRINLVRHNSPIVTFRYSEI